MRPLWTHYAVIFIFQNDPLSVGRGSELLLSKVERLMLFDTYASYAYASQVRPS